jgi:20S proteasome subunit beta 1
MAINFKDGVILGTQSYRDSTLSRTQLMVGITGADSRTTTGAYIANRVTDKLTQVHDTIWCCRSGSAADTQAVADIVHYQLGMYGIQNGVKPTTQTAAAMFQELCYENKDRLR